MILVVVAIYKLALKIAHRESGAETCARAFAVGFRSANFDEIGESSADRAACYVFVEATAVGHTGI
jgi:hypothetical protein